MGYDYLVHESLESWRWRNPSLRYDQPVHGQRDVHPNGYRPGVALQEHTRVPAHEGSSREEASWQLCSQEPYGWSPPPEPWACQLTRSKSWKITGSTKLTWLPRLTLILSIYISKSSWSMINWSPLFWFISDRNGNALSSIFNGKWFTFKANKR